ncbi:MAG: nucleotide sugar dehydrogenase [Candidatus Hadarchaeota archaeon]
MSLKITVFGLWHLGCVNAAGLAELGYEVVGTDFDRKVVEGLSKGLPPIYEPGLEELIKKNTRRKKLSFVFDKKTALEGADFIFITFDTKVDDRDRVGLGEIKRAAEEIAKHIKDGSVVVVSSQVPVGTCAVLKGLISKGGAKIDVACVPENLRLGTALDSFLKPDRVVLGANDQTTMKKLKQIFNPLKCELITMRVESAEMSKHALNAYMAACISFINEISDLCEFSGASAADVVRALKTDRRVSQYAPINPGLGFSGGTLARDVQVLRSYGDKFGYDTKFLDAVFSVNAVRKQLVLKKLEKSFGSIRRLQIGILGLTYKPGTDTLRRSLSLEVARGLLARGASVRAYDPKVSKPVRGMPKLEVCKGVEDLAKGSDVLVLLTEWPEFRNLPLRRIKPLMKKPVFFDAKNFLSPEEFKKLGFRYMGVGGGFEA